MSAATMPAPAPADPVGDPHAIDAGVVSLLTPHAHAIRLSASRLQLRLEGFTGTEPVSLEAVNAALARLVAAGMVEPADQGYQLTRHGLLSTRLPDDTLTSEYVEIRREQNRLGGAKYPGRRGVVLKQNQAGSNPDGLWHVRLEPTKRAGERIELFWTKELEVVAAMEGGNEDTAAGANPGLGEADVRAPKSPLQRL